MDRKTLRFRRDPAVGLDRPLLTTDGVAAVLSVPPATVDELRRDGRLPHLRIGRKLRFLSGDVEAYVASLRSTSARAR